MITISTELMLLVGSVLFFISMLVGKAGHRFGVPVLLLFLGVGMLFGSDGFGLVFENVQTAQAIGSICLCIILFSGGLDTKFSEIKPVVWPGVVLATVSVLLTALLTGIFTYWPRASCFHHWELVSLWRCFWPPRSHLPTPRRCSRSFVQKGCRSRITFGLF